MVKKNNEYTAMQRTFYDSTADIMAIDNHRGHNSNPDYYGFLLGDIKDNPSNWVGKTALDFGCGVGRNVENLLNLTDWAFADGCDISKENIDRSKKYLLSKNVNGQFNLFVTDGISLNPIENNRYDFVMSTIVLQHIAVYDIRKSIFKDLARVMKQGGLLSIQMAKYPAHIPHANYYDNVWDAPGTNGRFDVSVDNVDDLLNDLTSCGFGDFDVKITMEWDAYNQQHIDNGCNWVFVKAFKK